MTEYVRNNSFFLTLTFFTAIFCIYKYHDNQLYLYLFVFYIVILFSIFLHRKIARAKRDRGESLDCDGESESS